MIWNFSIPTVRATPTGLQKEEIRNQVEQPPLMKVVLLDCFQIFSLFLIESSQNFIQA